MALPLNPNMASRCRAVFIASAAAAVAVFTVDRVGDGQEIAEKNGGGGGSSSRGALLQGPTKIQPKSEEPKYLVRSSMTRIGHSACQCDSLPEPTRRESVLRRRQTLKRMVETATKTSLKSKYNVDWSNPIGEGAFGAVYTCTDRVTGERLACKKIDKRYTNNRDFQREMDALMHIRSNGGHPHICGLRENFDEGGHYYLVLDLVSGGEMFDHLIRNGAYSEADAARLVREVASALAFVHGIGVVHGDLKPENLMLSTSKCSDAVIKVVDFGCAEVLDETFRLGYFGFGAGFGAGVGSVRSPGGNTPAYSPPEAFKNSRAPIQPSLDCWALGVIIYIMLTGLHPFDPAGEATDEEIVERIRSHSAPPLKDSPVTAHVSDSAIDLIQKLMEWKPKKRLTAMQMLEHPWVRGETARTDIIADSDKKLSMFRVFKSQLQAKVFKDWCTDDIVFLDSVSKKTSLIEKSFRTFDTQRKGFLTARDFKSLGGEGSESPASTAGSDASEAAPLSLSGFSDLLSENMKNKYFPRGHVVYNEGDAGNHMYFINSGTIEVTTKDGSKARRTHGDFFGEGALLNPTKIRSATITCITPVHAIEISREYFEKYMASGGSGLTLNLREKDRTRKRNRAKTILRLQKNLKEFDVTQGDYIFKEGEDGQTLFILEEGKVDVQVQGKTVFSMKKPGDICGEHSLIMGGPRNTSAVCVADKCKMLKMKGRDFFSLFHSSSSMRQSLRELCLRRDFQKAIVLKTGKPFPSVADLREAFNAADTDKSGQLTLDEMKHLLMLIDATVTDDEIRDVVNSLDLDESGKVSFDEFKQIFGMDEAHAASM